MDIVNIDQAEPFRTKDGSEIRELLAHRNSIIRNQSLAEARIAVGGATMEHYHPRAEEIYYITHGMGRMKLGQLERDVRPGDDVPVNVRGIMSVSDRPPRIHSKIPCK